MADQMALANQQARFLADRAAYESAVQQADRDVQAQRYADALAQQARAEATHAQETLFRNEMTRRQDLRDAGDAKLRQDRFLAEKQLAADELKAASLTDASAGRSLVEALGEAESAVAKQSGEVVGLQRTLMNETVPSLMAKGFKFGNRGEIKETPSTLATVDPIKLGELKKSIEADSTKYMSELTALQQSAENLKRLQEQLRQLRTSAIQQRFYPMPGGQLISGRTGANFTRTPSANPQAASMDMGALYQVLVNSRPGTRVTQGNQLYEHIGGGQVVPVRR